MAIQNNLKEAKAWVATEKPQLPPSWLPDLLKKPLHSASPFTFGGTGLRPNPPPFRSNSMHSPNAVSSSSNSPNMASNSSKQIPLHGLPSRNSLAHRAHEPQMSRNQPQIPPASIVAQNGPLHTSTQASVLDNLSDFSDSEDLKLIDTVQLGFPQLKRSGGNDERSSKKHKGSQAGAEAKGGARAGPNTGSNTGSNSVTGSNTGSTGSSNSPTINSLRQGSAKPNLAAKPTPSHTSNNGTAHDRAQGVSSFSSSPSNDTSVFQLQNYIRICESKITLLSKWNAINESTSLSLDAKNLWHSNNFVPQLRRIEASQKALRSSFTFLDPLPATQDLSRISQADLSASAPTGGSLANHPETNSRGSEMNGLRESMKAEVVQEDEIAAATVMGENIVRESHHKQRVKSTVNDGQTFKESIRESVTESRSVQETEIVDISAPEHSAPVFNDSPAAVQIADTADSEYEANIAEARQFVLERRSTRVDSAPQILDDELEDDFGEDFMDGLKSSQVDDADTDLSGFLAKDDDDDLSSVDDTYVTQRVTQGDSQDKSESDHLDSDDENTRDDVLSEMKDIVLSQDVAARYGVNYDHMAPIEISDDDDEEDNSADFTTQLKEGRDEVVEITSEDEIPDEDLNALAELSQKVRPKIEVVSESDFSDDDEELIELSKSVGKKSEGRTIPPNSEHFIDEVYEVLNNVFKLPDFRPNQLEAVVAALNGKDVFVLIPTGGGKSLCYQLPALVKGGKTKGVTIVISPLISLMQDQVQHLKARNINAAMISSRGSTEEKHAAIRELTSGQLDLVYLSPEMVNSSNMIQRVLSKLYDNNMLARVVVDEAHCVSSWGHDFRPDYQGMSMFKERFPNVPIMALTATANEKVRLDIVHHLRMTNLVLLKQSFNRTNLFYEVRSKPPNFYEWIRDYVMGQMAGKTGIIYCHSKQSCETTAQKLNDWGISCMYYHAGMDPEERFEVQTQWQHNKIQLICATIAFGMGIDKPDVRFVIHMYIPKSLEGYYQETGRAGRDGKESDCIMFYSYKDARALQSLIQRDRNLEENARETHLSKIRQVVQYCENKTDCRRKQVLHYFNESFDPANCGRKCDNCCSDVVSVSRDVTEHCSNIVKMVQALQHDKVTVIHCQDVYKGSRSNKILKSGHHESPYHGKGRDLDRGDMERIFFHLQSLDCLLEYQVMKGGFASTYVKLGPNANSVLKGTNRIQLSFAQNSRTSSAGSNTSTYKQPRLKATGNGTGISHLRYQESFVSAREFRYEQEKENLGTNSRISLEKHTFNGAVTASNEQAVERAYNELRNLRLQKSQELGYGRPTYFINDNLLKELAIKLPTNARDFARLENTSKDQVQHFQYFKRLLGTLSRERKRSSSQDTTTQQSTFTQGNSTISEHASPYFQKTSSQRKKSQGKGRQRKQTGNRKPEMRRGGPSSQVRQMPI